MQICKDKFLIYIIFLNSFRIWWSLSRHLSCWWRTQKTAWRGPSPINCVSTCCPSPSVACWPSTTFHAPLQKRSSTRWSDCHLTLSTSVWWRVALPSMYRYGESSYHLNQKDNKTVWCCLQSNWVFFKLKIRCTGESSHITTSTRKKRWTTLLNTNVLIF